ncbi:MAG: L,D-transpeptidase family protein [Gammaproteobacteria bacterium]
MQASKTAQQLLTQVTKVCDEYPQHANFPVVIVNISEQKLYVYSNAEYVCEYPVSTSRFGIGQDEGSYKTPLGIHCVQEKIGDNAEFAEVFKARKRTHTCASIEHEKKSTDEDCITSRILWLSGLEEGINKGEGVDSHARYIYIHGTQEEGLIGHAASEGCIRMNNQDVIELYDHLVVSSLVIINK